MKIEGIRKLILGAIFLIIGTIMIFKIPDVGSKEIYFDYLWKLAGVLIVGNGIEHVAKGISKRKGGKE